MEFTRDSLNSGFLAMASKLDICEINQLAQRMGVHLGDGGSVTDENVPYDVLGPKNIAALDMASAYAAVANNGTRCEPHAIDKITGPDGSELPIPPTTCTQVIKPEIAATAAYALQGVMNSGGTGSRANPDDGTPPLIGKTGTHESAQTMLVDSSTAATTAVWVARPTATQTSTTSTRTT